MIVLIISSIKALNIDLELQLVKLLPEDFPSVKSYNSMLDKAGAQGYLVVAVEGEEKSSMIRFAEDFANTINEKADSLNVKYIDHRRPIDYIEENSLLFMEYQDLKSLYNQVKKKIAQEKRFASPFHLDLGYEKEVDFKYWEDKYLKKTKKISEYYMSDNENTLVVLLKSDIPSTDLQNSSEFVQNIKAEVEKLNPKGYDTSLNIKYTGQYIKNQEDRKTITSDLIRTSVIAVILVFVALFVFFRRLLPILVISLPLITGVIITAGIISTPAVLGHINILTGIIVSILLGLGIDMSIHFISNYSGLRNSKTDVESSIRISLSNLVIPMLIAVLTTTIVFVVMLFSDFKAFFEFGLIAGIGILSCFIVTVLLLPSLILYFEKHTTLKPFISGDNNLLHTLFRNMIGFTLKRKVVISSISLVFIVLSIFALFSLSFEEDLNKVLFTDLPARKYEDKLRREILKSSLNPAVIVADNFDDATKIYKKLNKKAKREGSTIDVATGLPSFIPDKQDEKITILKKMDRLIDKNKKYLKKLDKKEKKLVIKAKKYLNKEKLTRNSIPSWVLKRYEQPGSSAMLLNVYPKNSIALNNWNDIKSFAGEVTDIKIKSKGKFKEVSASGELLVMADIINLIENEGVILLTTVFVVIILFLLIITRRISDTLLILIPLSTGILYMLLFMVVFHIKFNFLNIIILPIIFGLGIDAGIYLFYRYRQNKKIEKPINKLSETIGAIFISSLTTLCGFSALLFAVNDGLNSIGIVANIGIIFTFLTSTFLLSSLLHLTQRKVRVYKRNFFQMASQKEKA